MWGMDGSEAVGGENVVGWRGEGDTRPRETRVFLSDKNEDISIHQHRSSFDYSSRGSKMTLDQPAKLVLSPLTPDDYDSMNDAFIRAGPRDHLPPRVSATLAHFPRRHNRYVHFAQSIDPRIRVHPPDMTWTTLARHSSSFGATSPGRSTC